MLRTSSSTTSTDLPTRSSSDRCSRSSIRCFSGGRSENTRCRNSDVSSSSRSGDSTPLTTTLRASVCSCASSSGDSSRPVKTTTGTSASALVAADALQHLEPRHVGQPQVEHHAVARLLGQRGQRRRAGVGDDDVEVVVGQQLLDAQLLGGVVLDDQQPLAARRRVGLDAGDRRLEPFGGRRLVDERERAARQPVLAILVERDDLHRDVPRLGILLQLAEHRPAEHVGQEHVERHRRRAGTGGPAPARRRRASPPAP